jgi:CheY-specific phosphatase CheX
MNAIFEVFEKMFFIFLEPVENTNNRYDHISSIDFEGRMKGGLSIKFSRKMAEMMARNMLGCEKDEITDHVLADCAKEAANMVCGNFLRKMSRDEIFKLGLPRYALRGRGEQEDMLPPAGADHITLSFKAESEEETLQLKFFGSNYD